MTVDLRQPGDNQVSARRAAPMDANRRVAILVLYASAFAFLLGGVWLLVGEQTWFDAEVAPLAGLAFIVAAVSDVAAVAVLKHVWSGRTPGRP